MQEEVENRTVNLAISTTKLTFRTIVNGYNAWKRHHQAKVAQKTSQLPVGKQSIKELIGQNQGVSSIPIEIQNVSLQVVSSVFIPVKISKMQRARYCLRKTV